MRNWLVSGVAMAALGGSLLVGTALSSAAGARVAALSSAPSPSQAVAEATSARSSFTKASFAEFVHGKTKAEIRAAFGSPTSVYELTDYQGWYYTGLPVYDADAGTRTSVELDFPQGQDFVDVVHY